MWMPMLSPMSSMKLSSSNETCGEEFGKGIDVAHRIEGRLNVYCAKMAR
jgi:hypothetical protein